MQNQQLANFYERDISKLIEEIQLFKNEADLWKTIGTIKNPAGNLALHLIGGLNYLIGTNLGKTGYVRDRDKEFAEKNVERDVIILKLNELNGMIIKTLNGLKTKQMEAEYPVFFDKPNSTINYVLTQLLMHLNYHLGQVNYLRRAMDIEQG